MNRIRTLVFAITISALMGAGAFAQVDSPPATEPGGTVIAPAETLAPGQMLSPAQTTPGETTPGQMLSPAQTTPGETTPGQMLSPAQTTQAQTTTTAPRNDGFNWGWIGLLGLAGLAGLRRSDARPVDRDAAYPATRTDATTTPRSVAH